MIVSSDKLDLTVKDKNHSLEISAGRTEGIDLPAPKLGEMTAKVNESLNSRIKVGFYQEINGGNKMLFSGTGRNAGLEFVGDIQELIKGWRAFP